MGISRHWSRWAAAAALLIGALVGFAAPAQAATVHGCPHGAVCIYPQNAGWNNDHPSVTMYSYGAHNLSNQIGNHYVLNNQYDDGGFPVIAVLCYGYNGTNCDDNLTIYQWDRSTARGVSWNNYNLTPINSVILSVFGP
jgi:hypothetical protein